MKRMLVTAALMLLAGCSGSSEETDTPQGVALVTLADATPGTIKETETLYGVAEDDSAAREVLSTPTEAILESIEAPVGTAVQKGQVVARLSPSPTSRQDLTTATAAERVAEEAFARAKRLRADGLVGDADVETARATAAAAKATRARLSSGSQVLRARREGYVEAINPAPGDLVAAGAAVATISNLSNLRAKFGAEPALARRIEKGSDLHVTPSAGGDPFTAQVLSSTPVADPQTRLASVFASIPPASGIGPGEALTGEVELSATGDAVTVPYDALLDDGGQPYVFVVAEGVAHRRPVATGASTEDQIAVTEGLEAGETVVVAGGTALEDGMKVRTR